MCRFEYYPIFQQQNSFHLCNKREMIMSVICHAWNWRFGRWVKERREKFINEVRYKISENITPGVLRSSACHTSLFCLKSHGHFSVFETLWPHLEAGLAIEGLSSGLRWAANKSLRAKIYYKIIRINKKNRGLPQ